MEWGGARCVRWVHRHVQADSSSLSRRKTSRGERWWVSTTREQGRQWSPFPARVPLSLSFSPHLLQNTRGHREASPSKYAHVSNVHFNHRSHRPSRAIAPSPLSFFLFFFSFFFASDLSFSPARTFHPPSDSIPCNIPLPQSPTYSLETAYTFVRVPPPVFLLLFARLYLSRMQRFFESCGVSNSFLAWNTARTRL